MESMSLWKTQSFLHMDTILVEYSQQSGRGTCNIKISSLSDSQLLDAASNDWNAYARLHATQRLRRGEEK